MTYKNLLRFFKKHLKSEDLSIQYVRLISGVSLPDILTSLDKKVKFSILKRLYFVFNKNIPIEYLVNHSEFGPYRLYVNRNVLIPRWETYEMISNVLKTTKIIGFNFDYLFDIGTGSGAISYFFAKNSNAKIVCSDISKSAIEVAKKNLVEFTNVSFIESDLTRNLDFSVAKSPLIIWKTHWPEEWTHYNIENSQ